MNQATSSIVLLARTTRWATTVALVFGAAIWLWGSVVGGGEPASALHAAFPRLAWVLGSLGLAVTGYGLLRLIQLMRIYESGVVFDPRAARLLAAFAAAIFLRAVIDILSPALLSLAAVIDGGQVPVAFAIRSGQLHVLFIALVFLLVARIMAVGHRLADDNAKIV